MKKIVVNKCFGGFGLSSEAIFLYAGKKGILLYPEKKHGFTTYFAEPGDSDDRPTLWDKEIVRDDPILVEVVEMLGDAANGMCAELKVVEIPDGAEFEIDDYDGLESVWAPRTKYA